LLRSDGHYHERFLDGAWQPTKLITEHMVGHSDYVDDVSEAEARPIAPADFVS
jgi:hypothetical protein